MSGYLKFGLIIIISILAVSCSFIPNELKTAEKLIEDNPDSALHILQNIPSEQISSGESRALYGLLMFQTLGTKKLPMKPDSLIDFSIEYFTNHPKDDRLAACYLYKARSYKYCSEYEQAMIYYLKALDELSDSKNNVLLGRINFDLGDIYNIQLDFKIAREKYDHAYNYFLKAGFFVQAFYSKLNIGRTYHAAKDYITADRFYKSIMTQCSDSILQGALFQEIGLNFFDSQKYDSALFYYKKVIDYPYLGYNRSIRYSNLSNLYFNLKKYDSAFFYASKAFEFDINYRTKRECYRIMTNCEFIKGNTKNVTIYMNKYTELADSLWKIDTQIKGSYMETTHKAKKEAVRNKHLALYWGLFASLILIMAYILYRFISHRNRTEKLKLKESHSEEKVNIHKKVVEDKRAVLEQKIKESKDQIKSETKGWKLPEREKQIRKIYEDLLHIDDTKFFYREMDIVLNNLICKLSTRYKGLTDKDIKWCCLHLLGVSNQDMLILLDYQTDNSLKTLKNRLPKKLKLENATQLGDFLMDILSED